MSSLFGKYLCSESFLYFNGKFVERRKSREKGNARRPGDPEIELFSNSFIRNISNTVRNTGWAFYLRFCFCLPRAQESFRQRLDDESAGSDPGAKITFRMKLQEGKVYSESRYS